MQTHSSTETTIRVWDLPLRLFHWLLVIVIAVAFLSSEEDSPLAAWHIASGWMAAVLVAFRLVWGVIGGEHARFANFLNPAGIASHLKDILTRRAHPALGHNPLGALAIVALLGLIIATIWTGVQLLGSDAGDDLHEGIAYALLALVGIHIIAVFVMSFATRENLARAMVTGRKNAALHPGAGDARPPNAAALVAGGLTVAGAAYFVLASDPQAFSPRQTEANEAGGDSAYGAPQTESEDDD